MGQIYTYDSAKGIVAMSPTGHFFDFEEKCPVGPQDSKTTSASKVAVKPSTFMIYSKVTALTRK